MTNIYDFESHKKAILQEREALSTLEGEEPDISTEIEWASKELEEVQDILEDLNKSRQQHEAYRTELVSYISGMGMAKRFIDGGELHGADFWSWVADVPGCDEQMEIIFTPDFETNTDE